MTFRITSRKFPFVNPYFIYVQIRIAERNLKACKAYKTMTIILLTKFELYLLRRTKSRNMFRRFKRLKTISTTMLWLSPWPNSIVKMLFTLSVSWNCAALSAKNIIITKYAPQMHLIKRTRLTTSREFNSILFRRKNP